VKPRWGTILLLPALWWVWACDYKPRNQGRSLYERHCQGCHMEAGQGLGELFPPVSSSDYAVQNAAQLSCIIRNGLEGPITVNGKEYNGEMQGNVRLTDVEISNLVHYLLEVMNEHENPYGIGEIRKQLEQCK